jgi:hypothetical protein
MSEALLACGRCRYYWVASAPYPPYKGGALLPRRCCCSTVRLPPIDGRPLGFAPPPHSGFAFIAAPERQRLRTIVLTWSPPVYRLDVHTSEGRLASLYARKRFLRMNFGELRYGEVRRIPIPRTPVNKAKKKHRSVDKPRSDTCERTGLRSASFGYILTSHNARRRLCPPQAPLVA